MEIGPDMYCMCPYPGCPQLVKRTAPGHQKACGDIHHLLLMCRRYCKARPEENKPELERCYSIDEINGCTYCVQCGDPLTPGLNSWPPMKCWCSPEHHLLWLARFCQNLNPPQRCKLEGCHKHVFVIGEDGDEPLRVFDFCGFSHSQQYWMLDGLQRSSPGSIESDSYVSEPSVSFIIDHFKAHISQQKSLPKFLVHDKYFFNKHPWEYLPDPAKKSCWIIATCKKHKNGNRDLKTKDGYHWKQQSGVNNGPDSIEGVVLKYRTYAKQKGKKEATAEQDCNQNKFSMQEYSFNDSPFHDYCVIKLTKGSASLFDKPNERKRKGRNLQGSSSSKLKRSNSTISEIYSDCSTIIEIPLL